MCTNETHKYFLVDEQDYGYYPIVVALYVENIAIITNIIHRIKRLLDISEVRPVSLGRPFVPVPESNVRVSMFGYKIPYHGK
jgi:hypothetical protein